MPAWSWGEKEQPEIVALLETPPGGTLWCGRLEGARGYATGKVLTVCAALAIARQAINAPATPPAMPNDASGLNLLEAWVDQPSDKQFDEICVLLFGSDDEARTAGQLSEVVWWALRCATAHPDGCGEVEWALLSLCEGMLEAGFSSEWLQTVGLDGVRSRMRCEP